MMFRCDANSIGIGENMRAVVRVLAIGVISLLGACVTTGIGAGDQSNADRGTNRAAPEARGELSRLGELPGQTISAGGCGVFLWSRREPLTFMFFADVNAGISRITLDDELVTLRSAPSVEDRDTVEELARTYESVEKRILLRVKAKRGEVIDRGVRLPEAVLSVSDDSGWQVVVPMIGIYSCPEG